MSATVAEHWRALELLPHDASSSQIERKFRRLALSLHPDKNPGDALGAKIRFQQLLASKEAALLELQARLGPAAVAAAAAAAAAESAEEERLAEVARVAAAQQRFEAELARLVEERRAAAEQREMAARELREAALRRVLELRAAAKQRELEAQWKLVESREALRAARARAAALRAAEERRSAEVREAAAQRAAGALSRAQLQVAAFEARLAELYQVSTVAAALMEATLPRKARYLSRQRRLDAAWQQAGVDVPACVAAEMELEAHVYANLYSCARFRVANR
jgi:colicin import membrane protein